MVNIKMSANHTESGQNLGGDFLDKRETLHIITEGNNDCEESGKRQEAEPSPINVSNMMGEVQIPHPTKESRNKPHSPTARGGDTMGRSAFRHIFNADTNHATGS